VEIADGALPERLRPDRELLVRRWIPEDAEALGTAIAESVEQLRPWLPWVANEPLTLDARRALITDWERIWISGAAVLLGAFVDGEVVGATSMHRRGPSAVEFGYWVRSGREGRGLATRIARIVTDTALRLPGVDHTEIHHDKANHASAAVPRKLGYTLFAEVQQPPVAPGEIGIEWRWRMDRGAWRPAEA
jgi:ribosomal-protein-serine acetyltransferase